MMTGMQNMMAGGRRKKKSFLTIEPCISHFFCTLRSRRYKMNQPKELGLKTLKYVTLYFSIQFSKLIFFCFSLFLDLGLRELIRNHVDFLPSTHECITREEDYQDLCFL